ncbi:hypothetical protein J7E88_35105 [Streptomyces sp. ISL-10]|uniref:hypothetical protein n=1 Tax=Streptomyces sp. ISL-10 TaxID=2819172 RepID=UPI001BE6D5EE|nr:hypothetical protein [Streptomyces sp. ISL-10]MBT2370361.1 hypothetical protein [Streptomyces sp. ISL-10]
MDGRQGNDQPLRWGDGDPLDGEDLGVGHRQQVARDVFGLEAGGGVGEDQAALLGETKQRVQCGDGVAPLPSAQR